MLSVVDPSMKKGPDTWRECVIALVHLGETRESASLGGTRAEKL